jgi:hypothetical protein
MPESERSEYEAEVKPFLAPLTSVAVVNRTDNGMMVGHVFLYVE